MIPDGTKVTGKVTVKPTTAYVGDNTEGKLTLYVPYYGVTGIGQITLSASGAGNVQIKNMQILPKKADETSATVTFQLDEGASAPFSDGEEQECEPLPVLVYDNYTITGRDNGFETAANFQGTPVSNSWLGKGTCKYNPTTKTYTQTIDIAINTDTENSRAGAVVVFSPSGRELARFIVEQAACEATNPDKPVINDITINKLVPSGANSANCYIITAPGRYELPAYMGAYSNSELADNLLCKGTPDIVWNDNESNNKIEFYQGHLSQDKIIIDINPTKENGVVTGHGSSISPGNAVISINDANGIQWSWHLWFCDPNNDPRSTIEKDPITGANMMNRALGAKKALELTKLNLDWGLLGAVVKSIQDLIDKFLSGYLWKDGLYYQWGRKDPLRAMDSDQDDIVDSFIGDIIDDDNSFSNSIKNPTGLLKGWTATEAGWSSAKTRNDPCPPGYKVPSNDVWIADASHSHESQVGLENLNIHINVPTTTRSAYTYFGKLTLEYQESIFYPYVGYIDAENECVKNKYDDPIPVNNKSVTSSNVLATKRYISNNFVLHYTNYRGALWSSSERSGSAQALHYSYRASQNKVTLNKEGSKYQEKPILGSWKDKTKTFPLTLTDGTYTDAFYDANSNPHEYTRSSESYKKADALPVRCVVEE